MGCVYISPYIYHEDVKTHFVFFCLFPEIVYETVPLRLPKPDGPLTLASKSYLALRLLHFLLKQRPDWFVSTLPAMPPDQSVLSANDSSLIRVLLDLWGSVNFFRRHSCLTLVQLQQIQPTVDLDLLLEDPGDARRKIVAVTSSSSTDGGEVQPLEGVQIIGGMTDCFYSDEPLLLLDFLLACAE